MLFITSFLINLYFIIHLTPIQWIDGLFLTIGNYSDYRQFGINLPQCGFRYVVPDMNTNIPNKCFPVMNGSVYFTPRVMKKRVNNSPKVSQRIFSGITAQDFEAPWTIYLEILHGGEFFGSCTGVLITYEWVLTTAHCFDNSYETTVVVNAGGNQRKKKFTQNKRVAEQHNINTICLPARNLTNANEDNTTFFGYGIINDNKSKMDMLLTADFKIMPYVNDMWGGEECAPLRTCVNYTSLSARTCKGDSGGPLVQFTDHTRTRAILLGTAISSSPGFVGCSERLKREDFSTISFHIDWILKTIQNN